MSIVFNVLCSRAISIFLAKYFDLRPSRLLTDWVAEFTCKLRIELSPMGPIGSARGGASREQLLHGRKRSLGSRASKNCQSRTISGIVFRNEARSSKQRRETQPPVSSG